MSYQTIDRFLFISLDHLLFSDRCIKTGLTIVRVEYMTLSAPF